MPVSTRSGPLLHVEKRRPSTPKAGQPLAHHPSNKLPLGLAFWVLSVCIISLLTASYLLPSARQLDDDLFSFNSLDSDHELDTLHYHPSPHFCSLPTPPRVCAHGGDIEAAPPNTLESITAALASGADCIEIDVSMTRDGQLVALHDRDLSLLMETSGAAAGLSPPPHRRSLFPRFRTRTHSKQYQHHYYSHSDSGSDGSSSTASSTRSVSLYYPRVGEYTMGQLHRLRWSLPQGPTIVPFETLLALVLEQPTPIAITVDIKLRDWLDEREEAWTMAKAVNDALVSAGCPAHQCLLWGKSDALVEAVKSVDTQRRVGVVVMNETSRAIAQGWDQPLRLSHLGVQVAGVHYRMASPELAQVLRGAGMELHVWTANTAGMMRVALDAGPDAVVTNRPRAVLDAIASRLHVCERQRTGE